MKWSRVIIMTSCVCLACGVARANDDSNEAEGEALASAQEIETKPRSVLLDRVTVVGSATKQNQIPGSAHQLGFRELDLQNLGNDDVHRMLLRLPGLNVTEEDGYGLRPNIGMRGTGTDRSANITLMEDGVLIAPAPYSAPAAYYFPLAGRMEGIEVRMGSSQIKYGPRTIGGALNLRSTSIPDRSSGRATLSLGGDDARKLHAHYGDQVGPVSWLVETYQLTNSGFKELDNGGDTGFELADYVGKVRLSASPRASVYQELELKLGYTEETSNETYLGLTDADFEEAPLRRYAGSQRDRMTNEHRQIQARHFLSLTDDVDLTTTLYRNEFQRNWFKLDKVTADGETVGIADILESPDAYATHYDILAGGESDDDALSVKANNREYYSMGVESIVGFSGSLGATRHAVEAGLRVHRDEEDRFQHSDGFRMAADGTMVRTSEGVPGLSGGGNNRVNRADAVALFVQDDVSFGRWRVSPGLRFESVRTTREQYGSGDPDRRESPTVTENETNVVIPGIGVTYAASRTVGLFGGVHRGFAPPGPGADDETEAEKSLNVEAGLRLDRGALRARAAGFFNDYDNLLGQDTFASGGTGSGDLFNAGEVDVYGAELGVETKLGGSDRVTFPIDVTYTWTVAEFKTAFSSSFDPWGEVEVGDRMPYVPEHQLGVGVGVETGRLRSRLFGNYVSRTRTEAGSGAIANEASTDSRLLIDLSTEWSFSRQVRGFVSVQNLTDDVYVAARRPAGVRPGMPRRVYAGLKLDL